MTALIEAPLPLQPGGELRVAEDFQQAVIGPHGRLPDVESGGLVALRIDRGQVEVAAVDRLAQSVRHEQDLAWRTPFAENMEPSDNWLPPTDGSSGQSGLRAL